MKLRKTILSCVIAASMLLGSVPMSFAAMDPVSLDPRSALGIGDGYIKGIGGIPTVSELSAEFTGDVIVIAPDGSKLGSVEMIPSESTVKAGDTVIGKTVIYGDASSDAKVNLSDASTVLKHIAAWGNELSVESADVDMNGAVNLTDVSAILKYIAGWEVTLGGEYLIDLSDGYKLLANDSELDAKLAAKIKEIYGVELEVIEDAGADERFITVGSDLHEKYDFIDDSVDGLCIDTYAGNVYFSVNGENALDELTAKDIYRGYFGAFADMDQRGAQYKRAVYKVMQTPAVTDGTNGMNGDILAAITSEKFTEPKNIIYMIGDGMGKNITVATEYSHGDRLYGGKLAMHYLPVEGRSTTYSTDSQITDSAAGGTALAVGYKTSNGTIAMSSEHDSDYKTLLELAAEKGKSTGVVATKSVTDATPAAFTAHVETRNEQVEIAGQQLAKLSDGTLDLVLGGGYSYYDDGANEEARAYASEQGVTYTKSWAEAYGAELPLLGLFGQDALATNGSGDEPHIAEMTDLALNRLSEDENGFFLMVEGSKIDSYAHSNEFGNETDEAFEFDCAIAVALRFVALNPDTVLIITADHETGALSIPTNPTKDNIYGGSRYASSGHHWTDVPVYAVGYGTEALAGNQENAEVAIFVAGLMGEDNFGQKSEVHSVVDVTSKANVDRIIAYNENTEHVKHTDDGILANIDHKNGIRYVYIPADIITTPEEVRSNITAFRVTYTNMGDENELIPSFIVKVDGGKKMYSTSERLTFIAPGDTVTFTYTFDTDFRYGGKFADVTEVAICALAGYGAELLISDISAVSRPLDK